MKHNRKIGPAVPFIHDSRHEVLGDHNARTVLIGRPTQEPNRIHFKSIRQFCIPKQKFTIYNQNLSGPLKKTMLHVRF